MRHFLLQFSLLAFLFSAVVPFFALYDGQLANAEPSKLEALYGDEIFICTESGFQWVKVADLGQGKHTPKPDSHFECAMCYVNAGGAKVSQLAPMVLALSLHAGHELRLHFATTSTVFDGLEQTPSNPRAPPFVV